MSVSNNIKKFLCKNFDKSGISRKAFCNTTSIPYSTLSNLINSISPNPDFITIVKIANYFNCSVDQILGRRKFLPAINLTVSFNKLDLHDINSNLCNFLKNKIVQNNISTYVLSKNIGFSKTTIHCFLKANSHNKMLSTNVIIAIADYFNVSVDCIIGRYPTNN
ncbi:MAG: helix-turn-helix domain-containing protein [Rickettsia endosymbiont of Glossina mortisans submortisans]|nr:helix-turn-helix domain-containing protein [Rickettsia endosymbiont of Glossina mortisans submortisans]